MAHTRINFLSVPVDIIPEQNLADEIMEIIVKNSEEKVSSQICFVSIWDILKARFNQDYMNCLKNASLVIPISKSILKGASFLKLPVPVRYNPFKAVIQILSVLDSHFKSLYLLGSRGQTLQIVEKNVRDTFPSLRIVGRCRGYYQKNYESNVIQAIYKASPSLVLVSEGIAEKDCWSFRRRDQFSSSIFVYYKDAFGIFSKRVKRVDEKVFDKGYEIFTEVLRNPLKIFLIFPFIWYTIVLIWYRLFKKF